LQPRGPKTFKLSNDKRFAEKLVDVVGLHLNPPEHAIVLCLDESQKSRVGSDAKEPTDLPRPLGNDDPRLQAERDHAAVRRAERGWARDRNLYVVTSASGVDQVSETHRRRDRAGSSVALGRRQLRDQQASRGPKTASGAPAVSDALHADRQLPAQLCRRWFRDLTQKRLRRGPFKSVRQLQQAIFGSAERHNDRAHGYLRKALP
jgi:hypothetical protein